MTPVNSLWIDAHAHIFSKNCEFVSNRRYTPSQDAPIETYLDLLDRHGIGGAVVVQPSFLGADNSYLCQALARHPQRLRGIAVVAPGVDRESLYALRQAGVRGIRLNLIGCEPPDLAAPLWQQLWADLAEVDFLVAVQAQAAMWVSLLPPLLASGLKLVIDHLGRPGGPDPLVCPGFRAILDASGHDRAWVTVSAPYRMGSLVAERAMAPLMTAFGPERLIWGSDWPWLQHEDGQSMTMSMDWLLPFCPTPQALEQIAWRNAAALFDFPPLQAPAAERRLAPVTV